MKVLLLNFIAVGQTEAELHNLKVEKLEILLHIQSHNYNAV